MQLDVLTSGIWQTNSTILSAGGTCAIVDPAYFPRELEAIAARAAERGQATAIVFTHGHWDHVMGAAAFPGVPVHLHAGLEAAIVADDPRAAQFLADAREFDERWYVPRPHGHCWPAHRVAVAEGALELGGLSMRALDLPGHSPECLALVVEDVLLPGDYLSPCEIPFMDDPPAYWRTLVRLVDLLGKGDIREVIPGHGPRLTAAEALVIARADLAYVDQILEIGKKRDVNGARSLELPRAADVPGMRDHHRDNCLKVGIALR